MNERQRTQVRDALEAEHPGLGAARRVFALLMEQAEALSVEERSDLVMGLITLTCMELLLTSPAERVADALAGCLSEAVDANAAIVVDDEREETEH